MPIDNAVLLTFCDESVRQTADLLAALLDIPALVLDSAVGKNLPALLGTTNEDLLKTEAWLPEDYGQIAPEVIVGSDSARRTTLTAHDVIGLLRVLVAMRKMIADNPALRPLVLKIAVNPNIVKRQLTVRG